MPKRKKQEHDFSVIAHRVVQEAMGQVESIESESKPTEAEKPDYAALGRVGGLKGGKARAKKLTPEQRREIARKAISAWWNNRTAP